MRCIDSQITADKYTFEIVNKFIYLVSAAKNDINLEIKSRITPANRRYYGLNWQFCIRELPRLPNLILYKTLILPVLLYGTEEWTLLSTNTTTL